ncbi:MAG TPA: DUF423 domain-containing protein [Caulobacteraceae bacterium]|jgi:uncharacterized membrane protein YgdD (TMEM256/DUF423 family)
MRWTPRVWIVLAAVAGLIAVIAGAFAAHGATDPVTQELLRTGSTYAFVHVLATLACAALARTGMKRVGPAAGFFLAGVLLFSGSLYMLAFGAMPVVGVATPVGGFCFMLGWLILIWAAVSARD